jgi:dihydrofolate synthase/folylpolyglutamate synthase
VIVDGAHTPRSAEALAKTIASDGIAPAVIVLGFLGDKDALTFAEYLRPVASAFVIATPKSPRASRAQTVVDLLYQVGVPVIDRGNVASAIEAAGELAGKDGTIVVTGSFSTVSDAREALGLARHDPDLPF